MRRDMLLNLDLKKSEGLFGHWKAGHEEAEIFIL